jgi:gamma-glutamylcyclotransferase (GGCT)/AIG2-like uncharacterized protein YtfP
MDLIQMAKRCPGARVLGRASLPGWTLCFNRRSTHQGGGVASIRKARGSRVWGVLYEIGPSCLKALDRYEGFYGEGHPGNHYVRVELGLRFKGKVLRHVLAYQALEQEAHIRPRLRYLASILRGARQNKLPQGYIETIERLAASGRI